MTLCIAVTIGLAGLTLLARPAPRRSLVPVRVRRG